MTIFLIFSQLMRHSLIEFFHLSYLLQMLNNLGLVDVEFFGNFLCSCKRISLNDPLNRLLTSDGWPLCSSSVSRLSSPLQNFLNHYCTVHLLAIPNALLMLWVVSATLQLILNLNKKIAQGTSLAVQTLPSNAGGAGSIPGWRAKIPHASWPKSQKHKTLIIL